MTKIKIVDEPMGKGKTNAAIKYLHENGRNRKVVYATPFLNEIARVKAGCPFMQEPIPVSNEGKKGSFMWLAEREMPIITTHSLLGDTLNRDDIAKFKEFNYTTLILDETLQAFGCVKENAQDFSAMVIAEYVKVEKDGLLNFDDYSGNLLSDKKQLLKTRNIYLLDDLENYTKKNIHLVTELLPELWDCFEEVWILTYRFHHSDLRAYFDAYDMPYQYWHLENGNFTEGQQCDILKMPPIDIYEGDMNEIGVGRSALSKSWYKNNPEKLSILKRHINNYIRNIMNAKSSKVCWSTFKKYKEKLAGRGYTKSYVSCNMRATNDFQDRTVIAYTVNRFLNPSIKRFLSNRGVEFDEDQMMLSEMLQFLFRTALRNNEAVSLYCPSFRMRTLLKEFIEVKPNIQLSDVLKVLAVARIKRNRKEEAC